MLALSSADHSVSPPIITIPRHYNAAYDLIERNLAAGRADKIAFLDDQGSYTYADVGRRSSAFANVLRELGIDMEQRILLCLHDTIDFASTFLGAIKAGVVPAAVNTLLTQADYEYMLSDSRARIAVVSAPLLPLFQPLLGKLPFLKRILVSGPDIGGHDSLAAALANASNRFEIAPTTADDPCFWLYSSGSTGSPKGTVHIHSSLIQTAELYARPVLGIDEHDVLFSAAKLFFAYGLGNGLTFPMSVGATAVLMAERPTPTSVCARLRENQPTIFCGVPTLYASMLASPELPRGDELRLRHCTSAGEALPKEIGKRWSQHFGVDILDGIGSTEMLHIFLSNRPGEVRYGTTGKPVPGYEVRIVDEDGSPVAQGEVGELQIAGPTSAAAYWNNCEKTRATFQGPWTRSGDKYSQDADGYFIYAGRSDDMLKVSGIYVSPIEVESALVTHDAVLEAAVVGKEDDDKLIKPIAFVVLKPGHTPSPDLAASLKKHVKALLAPYKYPRWFEFVDELPKTATGKIQRFKLRAAQGPLRPTVKDSGAFMTAAVSILKDEHRSMAAVIKGLVSQVGEAQAGRTTPDFYLVAAMLDYIQVIPERLHHPKEDEYLFRFLRSRCVEAGVILDTLEVEHTQGAELLADLRDKLDTSRAAGDFSAFASALNFYADFEWEHMRKEEEIVLPLAERHLSTEDWQAIDTAFRSNLDRTW